MPFFANYRVILLEDTNWFKSANEEMSSYIEKISNETVIIFVESEVDKRNKLYKQVKSKGYVCECKRMNNSDLTKWILVRLKKENKNITRENMSYLLEKLGDDMDNITSELDKLISYTLGRNVIEREDIDKVCISEITGKIFEMIDALGDKNQKKALDLYYDLIAVREAPMKILFMLTRQFNIMYQIKEMSSKGVSKGDMAKNMGIAPFVVSKSIKQCENFKLSTLKNAINYCIKLEEAVKQGNMNDKMAVELIIVKYSEKSGN
jgi:DNA polymerase-3 subunit delta